MLCILNFQFPPFPWNFFFRDEEDGFGIRKEEGEVGWEMGVRGGGRAILKEEEVGRCGWGQFEQ